MSIVRFLKKKTNKQQAFKDFFILSLSDFKFQVTEGISSLKYENLVIWIRGCYIILLLKWIDSKEGGVRGIIFDPGGKIMKTLAWGLRIKTNNEAEWLALLHGLEMIDYGSIMKLIFF